MYVNLGTVVNIKELLEMIEKHNISDATMITAAGAECHIMVNTDKNVMVFDDDDYADEWNETEE